MSSDGHASDPSRSVVDESDELESGADEVTHHQQVNHITERSPSTDEGSLDEEDEEVSAGHNHTVDKGDTSDDGQHPSPNQEPPSHQVPSDDSSEYSPHEAESSDSSDGQSEVDLVSNVDDASRGGPKNTRKRKSPTSLTDGGDTGEPRPLKKTKGRFNRAYLDLLNEDIEHAAAQYVPPPHSYDPHDERTGMPASQVGMTVWMPMEKERFFEALGRLGRDDAPGIARRVRTKGEMEVRQYLRLLRDGLALRRQQHELDPLELADFPAATELSHDCCRALEAAADGVALGQAHAEEAVEMPRYGADWLVTQENCKGHRDGDGDGGPEGRSSDPAAFLNTPNYLKLSERLFMNGPSVEANWRSVDGDTPSIRRTTLEDLHSLAVTLTRRLVAASIYMATTRIRAERGYKPNKPNVLREKDVHAAALSLGLRTETRPFLARCPRRLGLHVYEEPPKSTLDDDSGEVTEPMDYDDVETALGGSEQRALRRIRSHEMERIAMSSEDDSIYSDSEGEIKAETASENSRSGTSDEAEGEEDADVEAEADEVIFYSAVDQPQTKRDRQALLRRIKAEREQERYAEAVDAQATYQEEGRMWGLLGQPPPEPLVDPGSPPSGRRLKISVGAAYSVGRDWRAKTKVMSQWESQYRPHGW